MENIQRDNLKTQEEVAAYVSSLKKSFNPKVKTETTADGDPIKFFYDDYRMQWTTYGRAFKGYVLKHMLPFIDNVLD